MSLTLFDGSQIAVASTYGSANATTAVTNAASAVFSQTGGHGIIVGDFVEITSPGWPGIDGRLARVSAVSTNDITLEGIDTADVNKYPVGGAASGGSLRRITAWQTMGQILRVGSEGGDQKWWDYQFANELQERSLPTTKAPLRLTLELADDLGHAQMTVLKAAEAAGTPRAMRFIFRGGSGVTPPRLVLNGLISVGTLPQLELGKANTRLITVGLAALPTEYNS